MTERRAGICIPSELRLKPSTPEHVSSEATLDMASFGSPSQSQSDIILPMPAEAADPTRAEAVYSNKRRFRWLPTRGEKHKLQQSLHRPELPLSAANNDTTVQDLLLIDQHSRESLVDPGTAEVRSRWDRPFFRRLWPGRKVKAPTTSASTRAPKLHQLLSKIHDKIFRKRSPKNQSSPGSSSPPPPTLSASSMRPRVWTGPSLPPFHTTTSSPSIVPTTIRTGSIQSVSASSDSTFRSTDEIALQPGEVQLDR
ncbi:hypothetical protein DFS34DRAFT_114617 [Phlyctochytrium arcticum]|nr:hypothetical protein DFS34DRAFT_114617 [Phlyctochytrium arcticum]